MRRILSTSLVLAPLAGLMVLAGSCQTYDFEPVVPLAISQKTASRQIAATALKPNMMLVVDSSFSMDGKIDPGCSGSCATRMTELKSAMQTFLSTNPTVARMGLINYPQPIPGDFSPASSCRAADLSHIKVPLAQSDDDATLRATASSINSEIQALTASGGTPTRPTLDAVGTYAPLLEATRSNFILLLTDGLPNCNDNNPNTCNGTACNCTQAQCSEALQTCSLGCLDRDGTVSTITGLVGKGIRTIVVGFGSETGSGQGVPVLTAMAQAGGFPRRCPNGNECGTGDFCKADKTCNRPFYQAANGTELATALGEIGQSVSENPCEYVLSEQPSDPRFLSVVVDGTAVQAGTDTWRYDQPTGKVLFQGALCAQLRATTTADPITLEFRIVQAL